METAGNNTNSAQASVSRPDQRLVPFNLSVRGQSHNAAAAMQTHTKLSVSSMPSAGILT